MINISYIEGVGNFWKEMNNITTYHYTESWMAPVKILYMFSIETNIDRGLMKYTF